MQKESTSALHDQSHKSFWQSIRKGNMKSVLLSTVEGATGNEAVIAVWKRLF